MILSNLIVKWLEWIIEIGLWLLLAACFIFGVKTGDGFIGSLLGGLLGVLLGGILSAVIFGFFIVLNDIRRILQEAVERRQGSTSTTDA